MIFRLFILILLIPAFLLAKDKAPIKPKKYKVIVFNMDMAGSNISSIQKKIVLMALKKYISGKDRFILLQSEKIDELMRKINRKEKNQANALKIGKILDLDFVFLSVIKKPNNNEYNIKIKLISVEKGEAVTSYKETFPNLKKLNTTIQRLITNIDEEVKMFEERKDIELYLSGGFNYIYPLGSFGNIVNPGYGPSLEFGAVNILKNNLMLYINVSYYFFSGVIKNIDSFTMIPIFCNTGYKIEISDTFFIAPFIGGGMTLLKASGFNNYNSEFTAEIMGKIGISLGLSFNSFRFILRPEFQYLFEENNYKKFITINAGGQYVF